MAIAFDQLVGKTLVSCLACVGSPMGREDANAASGTPRAVVGPVNAEDLERIPGSRWIIASGMASPAQPTNVLSLVDTSDATSSAAWPDAAGTAPARGDQSQYAGCKGLPDLTHFSPHGIALRDEGRKQSTLYAINDGPRAGLEIFRVDASSRRPAITWIGCVEAPPGTHPNAVAAMPDGGFLMSSMMRGKIDVAIKGLLAGEPSGEVFRWRPGRGFESVKGSQVNGANGITVSPDGKTLFVNAWSARQIIRLPLEADGLGKVVLQTDFLPDNIKWTGTNALIVTGQAATMPQLIAATSKPAPMVPLPSTIALIDPMTMQVVRHQTIAATADFGGASIAIRIGSTWWAGSFRADRIARWHVDW